MLTPLPASMANTISAELAATTDGVANEVGIGVDDLNEVQGQYKHTTCTDPVYFYINTIGKLFSNMYCSKSL